MVPLSYDNNLDLKTANKMQTKKIFGMSCLLAVLVSYYATSFAQENGKGVQPFVTGKIGGSVGTVNCLGTCSTNPTGTIGVGISGREVDIADTSSLKMWNSVSLEYKNYQFYFNGNPLTVQTKAINLAFGYFLPDHPQYILTMGLGWGWQTSSSPNMADRTTATPYGDVDLLYQVSPALYFSFGYAHDFIFSGYPDFISNSVELGLRWYP